MDIRGLLADLFFEREYRCEKQAKDLSQPYAYDELKRYAKDFGLNMKDFQLANISMTYSHGHYDFKVTYCHPQYGFYFNSAYPRGTVEYASLVELTDGKVCYKEEQ